MMTQTFIAEKAQIGSQYLNKIINAHRNPSPKLAEQLEELTGIGFRVWLRGTKAARRKAWSKFTARHNQYN